MNTTGEVRPEGLPLHLLVRRPFLTWRETQPWVGPVEVITTEPRSWPLFLMQTRKQKAFSEKPISHRGVEEARWYQSYNTYNTYSAYISIFMTGEGFKG